MERQKKQIIYILASKEMIKKDYYKVGGIESSKNMKSRLCTYNSIFNFFSANL